MPDLQIAQVVPAEAAGGRPAVGLATASPRRGEQFGVPRVRLDHALPLRVKEVLEHERGVGVAQRRRPA